MSHSASLNFPLFSFSTSETYVDNYFRIKKYTKDPNILKVMLLQTLFTPLYFERGPGIEKMSFQLVQTST